ncbi:hypothetical protein RND71_007016 [Anisodus tanguticus]|uniref:Uncharacterized protein n=1 Tax=Anisodus tanguticus TaxID=243964 RepID=A0AAE1VJQ7_9SOLA|nr:hypothetical protein RND71_007016 [Anisodus tanguticus]
MAIPATGRPPPEVGHHPPTPPQPLDYSNLFKSSPTIPNFTNTETANNGGNLSYGGSSSPMVTSIPIKPIVYLHGESTVSQQNPIPTTNALIHAPSNNWTTVTRKNKKNKNQNPKPPSKVTGTVTPATETVIPVPRAIGNTVQVSESVFRPKNTPPKISDAGNPTGILGGAGNPTGNPTGTLGGAGNLP